MLQGFIEALIEKFCPTNFFRYKIIFIGGGTQVVSLMKHNEQEQFLSSPEKVMAILDGDQKNEKFTRHPGVHAIPIESVEKAIYAARQNVDFPFRTDKTDFTGPKDFHRYLQQKKIATQKQIFDYLINKNDAELQEIASVLRDFLVLTT